MPTLYLIDLYTPSASLGSAKINDTLNVATGFVDTAPLRGSFPVTLPFDIPIDGTPSDVTDLNEKKFAGMLSLYPGYQNILFDSQIDATGWDAAASFGPHTLGERLSNAPLSNGTLQSITIPSLGTAPTNVIVRWEAFSYVYDEATSTRRYKEEAPTLFTVMVSFNALAGAPPGNDAIYTQVLNGTPLSVPLAAQGVDFKIQVINPNIDKILLGSWALIY